MVAENKLVLSQEAINHLAAIDRWYEDERVGLGEQFLLSLEAVLASIRSFPTAYPVSHRKVRRALTPRFPYNVFYIIEPDMIVVTGIHHAKRHPRTWRRMK